MGRLLKCVSAAQVRQLQSFAAADFEHLLHTALDAHAAEEWAKQVAPPRALWVQHDLKMPKDVHDQHSPTLSGGIEWEMGSAL